MGAERLRERRQWQPLARSDILFGRANVDRRVLATLRQVPAVQLCHHLSSVGRLQLVLPVQLLRLIEDAPTAEAAINPDNTTG